MNALVLCVFDNIQGPVVSLVNPRGALTNKQSEQLCKLMDIHNHGFFLLAFDGITTANLIFNIPSDLGRGHVECLQISIVLEKALIDPSLAEVLQNLLCRFEEEVLEIPKLYCFLHPNSPDYDYKISEITSIFDHFYEIAYSTVYDALQDELKYQALFHAVREVWEHMSDLGLKISKKEFAAENCPQRYDIIIEAR
ncbi:MAG TPA: hypothetical protein VKK79_23425 [Candidatus Lokiarchaeia archaeon]|nr:hypothetical protein [Candidatus Lokiarchaeia archaeon]